MRAPSLLELLEERSTAFFVGILLLTTLDTVVVDYRASANLALRYWLSSVAAAFWVALLMGAVTALLGTFATSPCAALQRRAKSWSDAIRGASWGLCVGLLALLLLRVWDLPSDPYRLRILVPLVFLCAGTISGVLWTRMSARSWVLACAALSLIAFAADALVLRRLYLGFHDTATVIAIAAAALACLRLDIRLRAFPLLVVLAIASQVTLFADLRDVRALGLAQGTVAPKLFRLLHTLSDRDRDGFSPILGGGDCDDDDDARAPGRCEIANNGVDDNCNGLVDGVAPVRPAPVTGRAPEQAPHIYIVLADAMRGDYGASERSAIAPEIEDFAASSLDFSTAYTPYPSTYRAIVSTLQGRYWRYVGAAHPTLFRLLADHGYDAQLWIAEQRLLESDQHGIVAFPRDHGATFHLPATPHKATWTTKMIDEAIEELAAAAEQPRLRWLHLLDTHRPCMRQDGSDSALACYRNEVAHTSYEFGRLWKALRSAAADRGVVVIFIADHGEEFGDHDGSFHGSTLFEENIRVPMIVHLPGIPARVIEDPVSLIDLAPTLLAYLGIDEPAGYQGINQLSEGPAPAIRVLSEIESVDNLGGLGLPALHMARDQEHKLIFNVSDNLLSYYDLQADPREQQDLYPAQRYQARPLLEVLRAWQDIGECREP